MENQHPAPNPYDVLGLTPAASSTEVVAAVAMAMKARRYPVKQIAEAQKALMNPERRLVADFLRPLLPPPQRFKHGDYEALTNPAPILTFIEEYDGLEAHLAKARDWEKDETHA